MTTPLPPSGYRIVVAAGAAETADVAEAAGATSEAWATVAARAAGAAGAAGAIVRGRCPMAPKSTQKGVRRL